jgi:predicted nucleic acid-binding protein
MTIRAVLDADVLYPMPLRDTLLSAAAGGCFQARWSPEILDEAIRNLLADRRIDQAGAKALLRNLDRHFEDAVVENYRPFVAQMQNHPKDRHVAACAVAGGASLIVTSNIKDFGELPNGIDAISPDAFLLRLLEETPQQLRRALAVQSARLRRPPMDVPAILDLLRTVAPSFVSAFRTAGM